MLSVVVITKNEESQLRGCLRSIDWVKDIVVVDAESTDATREIAREYTDRVFIRAWPGFGPQKNFGIDQVRTEWVLVVDADERVSPELAIEIQQQVERWSPGDPVAYRVSRRNFFYGQWVRWGGAYPDYQIRLFRKRMAQYNDVEIHENLLVSGEVGTLQGHLAHYTENQIADHFKKFGPYTTLAAHEKHKVRSVVRWYHFVVNPLVVFVKTYLFKKGFRDGVRGGIFAIHAGMYTFVKYVKLREHLQRTHDR
ncbi:MAG: glycosyltransferase [Nitrospirales bacterium]|nr:glycosyltransferase [Nitrospirales bacterium]